MSVTLKISFGFLLFVYSLPEMVMAADHDATFLRIERNRQTQTDLQITSIGGLGFSRGYMGHADLTYFESDNDGDVLALDLGADYSFHSWARLFVGGGILLGYNSDENDYTVGYYPEAGIAITIAKKFGIVFSAKRYFKLYDRTEDAIMIGLFFRIR